MRLLEPRQAAQVTVEIVVSTGGRVVDVWLLSPARRCDYRVGDGSKRCDFALPIGALGGKPAVLFTIRADKIGLAPFSSAEIAVAPSDDHHLAVAVGDTIFTARWCEEADLRATWSDGDTKFVAADPDKNTGVRCLATCTITVPVRGRCQRCRASFEGSIVSQGSCTKDTESAAMWGAHAQAFEEAQAEAALASCPHCGHRESLPLLWFAAQCAAAVALIVGVPAWLATVRHARIGGSILIVPAVGVGLLLHAVARWHRASGMHLRDARGRKAPGVQDASSGTPAAAEWRERLDEGGAVVLVFDGINVDEQERLTAGRAQAQGCLTTLVAIPVALAIFVAFLALLGAGALVTAGAFSIVVIIAVLAAMRRRDESVAVVAAARGPFTLRLSSDGFDALGPGIGALRPRFPLDAIQGFEGGEHLAVRRLDKMLVTLPCRMASGNHQRLVARLNELLGQARSSSRAASE